MTLIVYHVTEFVSRGCFDVDVRSCPSERVGRWKSSVLVLRESTPTSRCHFASCSSFPTVVIFPEQLDSFIWKLVYKGYDNALMFSVWNVNRRTRMSDHSRSGQEKVCTHPVFRFCEGPACRQARGSKYGKETRCAGHISRLLLSGFGLPVDRRPFSSL